MFGAGVVHVTAPRPEFFPEDFEAVGAGWVVGAVVHLERVGLQVE